MDGLFWSIALTRSGLCLKTHQRASYCFPSASPDGIRDAWLAEKQVKQMPQGADPRKLIYLLFRWGWRGPVALALVIFGVWLISGWVQ